MNIDRVAAIKQTVDPISLARRYLGQPVHERGHCLWYKSPFRSEERTASFCVSEKGLHDFGTSQHYDVIDFVMNYFRCSFQEACNLLERDYGIISNPYITDEVAQILKKQAEDNKLYTEKVKTWYNEFSSEIACIFRNSLDEIEKVKHTENFQPFENNRYVALLDVNCKLEGLLEFIDNVEKFEHKEKLYQRRGELEDVFGRYKKIVLQVQ